MKPKLNTIQDVFRKLYELQQVLANVDYSKSAIESQEVGEHLNALEAHIDNAQGRLSTLAQTIRRVEGQSVPRCFVTL